MNFEIDFEQEVDGRWIAEVPKYFLNYLYANSQTTFWRSNFSQNTRRL
jgi:hypothetical protein